MAGRLLERLVVTPILLLASALFPISISSGTEVWPAPVGECLLALDTERRSGGRRTDGGVPFAVVERRTLTLATECGANSPPRAMCSAKCLDLCLMEGTFLPHHPSQVVLAGAMGADRNEIWVVERHAGTYRRVSNVALPNGQPVLIPAALGKRFAEVQAHIDGIALPDSALEPEQRVAFFVLVWRPIAAGWDGSLYMVVWDARTAELSIQYLLTLESEVGCREHVA